MMERDMTWANLDSPFEERADSASLVNIVITEGHRGGPVVNLNIVLFDETRTWLGH